jgi:hypothetical protein
MTFTINIVEEQPANIMKQMADELLLPNGKIRLHPASHYSKYTYQELRVFMHFHCRYSLPTLETIEYLKNVIDGRSVIEIGAGYGDYGHHLGIPTTDSKVQSWPEVKAQYAAMMQPTIDYPDDVEELEAIEAVKKYNPEVVFASWVTQWIDPDKPPTKVGSPYGVKEDQLLDLVDTYILVGNVNVHGDKDILKRRHDAVKNPHIISRSEQKDKNRIYIWKK